MLLKVRSAMSCATHKSSIPAQRVLCSVQINLVLPVKLLSAGTCPSQVGALAEACRTYAAEARRLTPPAEAEALAAQFAQLQQSLEQAPGWQQR